MASIPCSCGEENPFYCTCTEEQLRIREEQQGLQILIETTLKELSKEGAFIDNGDGSFSKGPDYEFYKKLLLTKSSEGEGI